MDISIVLIVVVLGVYLVWKLMGTSHKKKNEQRRFNIRKHRIKKQTEDDDDIE